MNCKIIFQKRRIILALTDYFKESRELNCVAGMTLYEGTKCWVVTDVRLSAYRVPSPYAFGADSGNMCALYKSTTSEELNFYKTQLREYIEDSDGNLMWCTFDGIVRGSPTVNGYKPSWVKLDQPGFFGYMDGLKQLNEIKAFWKTVQNLESNWRINNVHLQPTMTELFFKFRQG